MKEKKERTKIIKKAVDEDLKKKLKRKLIVV